ncbi:MAG: hypothetical protein DRJ69_01855, partial [Thermoprotei archaeon]
YRAFIWAEKPGTYLALLSEGCVSYAFMTGPDAYFASGSFIMDMLPYLEPVMKVPGAEVLKIPPLSGPEADTSTVLLRQSPVLVLYEDFDGYAEGDIPKGWEAEGNCGVSDGELHMRGNATCTISDIELPAFRLMMKMSFLGVYSSSARARIYFGQYNPENYYSIDIYVNKIALTGCTNGTEKTIYEEATYVSPGVPSFLTVEVLGLSVFVSMDTLHVIDVPLPSMPEGRLVLASEDCHLALDDVEVYQLFPEELSYENVSFMLSLSGLRYTPLTDMDPRAYDADTIIMTDGLYDSVAMLLRLVEKGSRLVVLNGLGLGAIAANLSISYTDEVVIVNGILVEGELREIPAFSVRGVSCGNTDVDVIAYFSSGEEPIIPYAFKKNVGSGEVLYLHVQDYFKKLLEPGGAKWKFFNGLEVLGSVIPGERGFGEQARFPDTVKGLVELEGDVELEMKSILSGEGAAFSAVDVDIEPGGPSVEDVDIRIIEIKGDVLMEAHLPSAKLGGQRGLPCAYTFVMAEEGGELVLKASRGGSIRVDIDGLGQFDIRDAVLKICSEKPMSFYASSLHVLANGRTSFENVWCHKDGAPIVLKGTSADVEGVVELLVRAADVHVLVLEELELKGDIRLRPEEPMSLFPLLHVRWGDLLLGYGNLMALTIAYSLIATWLIWKFLSERPYEEGRIDLRTP